ncbi:hypothetical protein NC652_041473 [Populus alba x Populus x berolinensis]|nr:hypothetical protein NC652_041473 [Populus alba x Populus x berolinensis]
MIGLLGTTNLPFYTTLVFERIEAARIAVTLTIKLQSGRISPVAVRLIYDHYGPERCSMGW